LITLAENAITQPSSLIVAFWLSGMDGGEVAYGTAAVVSPIRSRIVTKSGPLAGLALNTTNLPSAEIEASVLKPVQGPPPPGSREISSAGSLACACAVPPPGRPELVTAATMSAARALPSTTNRARVDRRCPDVDVPRAYAGQP
jgi:hypothetical protein